MRGRREVERPKIVVRALGARQKRGRGVRAEEFSGGVGVDRPSVRTDERCYTDKGVWDGVRRGEVGCDWRSIGKMKMTAGCDRDHGTAGDDKVGRRDGRRFENVGESAGELRVQQNA